MGEEFKTFEPFLKKEGIALRHSCPYLHEQNGKIERKHGHIVETGLTPQQKLHLTSYNRTKHSSLLTSDDHKVQSMDFQTKGLSNIHPISDFLTPLLNCGTERS